MKIIYESLSDQIIDVINYTDNLIIICSPLTSASILTHDMIFFVQLKKIKEIIKIRKYL